MTFPEKGDGVEMDEVIDEGAQGEGEVDWIGPEADGRRDLKKEADSVEHMLFHFPKNPYCRICQEALMQRKPNRRRKDLPDQYKVFGDMITMDHIDANDLRKNGLHGEKDMLIVFDLATAWIAAYPVMNKTAGCVVSSLINFLGQEKAKAFYSDKAPELLAGVEQLPGPPVVHRTSIPGIPQTNGIAESRVKSVIRGVRTNLLQAGLPHVWWPHAARCYAVHSNVAGLQENTPMQARHKEAFKGEVIPFGALVFAMPSGINRKRNFKFEAAAQPAVFLGYVVQDGGKWFGEYVWAFVSDFVDASFYSRARWSECRVPVHTGRELRFNSARPFSSLVGLPTRGTTRRCLG